MGVTKRAGRRKDASQQEGARGGTRGVFESTKKKEVGLSDLTLVSKITNEAINDNLKLRFEHAEIYTYIGHVLVSVNPFRQLPIYSPQTRQLYEGKNRLEAPPHVYAIAESAHHHMQHYNENQCVIISGESGAGKTEAAKKLMEYIVSRTGGPEPQESAGRQEEPTSDPSVVVKNKVIATNPLLEAFGNAKTLRNNNSSRFGKYLELQFKGSKRNVENGGVNPQMGEAPNLLEPVGASVSNYLLEKSRVVGQTMNERNFHIFYQFTKAVVAGHDTATKYRDLFGITGPGTYEYLRRSNCLDVPGMDDLDDFDKMLKAMGTIQIGSADQDNIFRVLAIILWLGNVSFVEDDSGNTTIADLSVSEYVGYLLQVDHDSVIKALTLRHVETGSAGRKGESFEVPLNITQATAVRDALSKALYFNLFDWIVQRLNISLRAKGANVTNTIGVLDIYGFEIFEKNSFEQLCINYVNEKLQQIFIQLTLKTEQEEYAKEQIQWTPIKYFDNKIVCDLIEERRPPGIFAALNDACATAHADSSAADQTFVQRLNGLSSNAHFQPRQGQFVVKHYAGDVHYTIDGMTDKNKDQLLKDLLNLVARSKNPLVNALFPQEVNQDDRRRPPTAGDKIKASANDLVATLMKCSPSYIRTIKPNENKSPSEYNTGNVLHQIKYLGLQENVRIRRSGFAYRQTFDKFCQRFYPLSPEISPGVDLYEDWTDDGDTVNEPLAGTKRILKDTRIAEGQFQLGVTKVFIKNPETIFALEDMRDRHYATLVRRLQKQWRKRKINRVTESQRARDLGHEVLQNRKERRRFSLIGLRRYLGDYLGVDVRGGYGELVRQSISLSGNEKTLFSCRCELLVTKFGRSSKPEPRMLILTNKAVYIVVVALVNQQATIQVERAIPITAIKYISASSLKDDWFSLGVGSPQEADPLINCIFKTEFFTHLTRATPGLNLRIGDSIEYNKKPGKPAFVKAVQDPSVGRDDFYKSGKVHTGPGEPPNSRSKPTPPAKERPKQNLRPVWDRYERSEPSRPAATPSDYDSSPPPKRVVRQPTVPQPKAVSQPLAPINNNSWSRNREEIAARVPPPPPPPPATILPSRKKNMRKALYDFDGASTGFVLQKGEVLEWLNEEMNGWSKVKREGGSTEGWAPSAYLAPYTPPAPAPSPAAPSTLIRNVAQPPPTPQANGTNGVRSPSPLPGAKPTPPILPKRPAVRGKKPAPPPMPRDSAIDMSISNGGSGRDTPDSDSGKKPSLAASDLASMIKARGAKMQGEKKDDDDW